jgi:uncharacterized membrane protein
MAATSSLGKALRFVLRFLATALGEDFLSRALRAGLAIAGPCRAHISLWDLLHGRLYSRRMSADTSHNAAAEEPIFSALLTPHRSLDPTGFMLVMVALIACSFTAGIIFWSMGAWPVVGFFGLDLILVQLAFRLNYRAARASEEIHLSRDALTVRKTAPSGRFEEYGFNPYWARLEVDRHPEIGVTRLRIASHGKRLDIAGFLGPGERESFAAAFAVALSEARTAPVH